MKMYDLYDFDDKTNEQSQLPNQIVKELQKEKSQEEKNNIYYISLLMAYQDRPFLFVFCVNRYKSVFFRYVSNRYYGFTPFCLL